MINACFLNDSYLSPDKAYIRINDLGLLRGYGVFDFCRAMNGRPFLLPDYFQRFRQSATLLDLELALSDSELTGIVTELCKRTDQQEFGIRFILTGGYTEDGFSILKPNLIILTENYKSATIEEMLSGVKLMSHEFQRELPEIKSTNYLTAIRLQKERIRNGAYDILYHSDGKILELTRSNFFLVKGNKLITPGKNVFKGITRKVVINLTKAHFVVEERDILWDELLDADAAFLTSTGKKITSIHQIDEIKIGNGNNSVTEKISGYFREFESKF